MGKFCDKAELANNHPSDIKFLLYSEMLPDTYPAVTRYKSDVTEFKSHLYYLISLYENVCLHTYENFEGRSCNQAQQVLLNSFNKRTKTWFKELKYHKKFSNFHQCPLVLIESFGMFLHFEKGRAEVKECIKKRRDLDCSIVIDSLTNFGEPAGVYVEIFNTMAKVANFESRYRFQTTQHDLVPSKHPVMSIFVGTNLNFLHGEFFTTVMPLNSHYMFAVTPTEFYNNYEKLWLPFDDVTWFLLLLTFLIAFVAIFVLNFIPERFKLLFYGGPVHSPALNVIHIFFGISQMKLPDASVPRFILMLFITFCLIFRTCYQSELFEFMTSDMRKPPPNDVEDLIERNYTIVACIGHEKSLKEVIRVDDNR
ncbi:hypothetical protein ACKWTF_014554 [Chironomus riparius]